MSSASPLRISEVARKVGVSPDTLRHYERKGLLPPARRSTGGYRLYSVDVIESVTQIRSALAIGFTIEELGRIFRARDHGAAPCHQVRAMAVEKLQFVEQQIEGMTRLQRHLKRIIKNWDAILASTPAGRKAHLLKTLGKNL